MSAAPADHPHPGRERIAAALLAVYKHSLGPVLQALSPTRCKYLPTCSDYAYLAVIKHGWLRGGWLALRRLVRCHPFTRGGHDPVP